MCHISIVSRVKSILCHVLGQYGDKCQVIV